MAKLLKLPSLRNSLCTFGSQGPQSIDTYIVHFSIITKDGTQLDLQAYVLNQIISPIQRGPLQQLDKFLQSISPIQLADVIPESLEMASIDILVGSDFFGVLLVVEELFCHQDCFSYYLSWDICLQASFWTFVVMVNVIIINCRLILS